MGMFRAALYHPDKQPSTESRSVAEPYFVRLRLAQDTLLDPTRRFAYERFGPTIDQWRNSSSIRDYVIMGVQSMVPFYVGSLFVMIVLTTLGYLDEGRYVRNLSIHSPLSFFPLPSKCN